MSQFTEADLKLAFSAVHTDEIFKTYTYVYKTIKKYDRKAKIPVKKESSFSSVLEDLYTCVKSIQNTFGVGPVKVGYYKYKEVYNTMKLEDMNSISLISNKTIIEKYKKFLTKKEIKETRASPQAIIDVMYAIAKFCVVLETLKGIMKKYKNEIDNECEFRFEISSDDYIFFYMFKHVGVLEKVYFESMKLDGCTVQHPSIYYS